MDLNEIEKEVLDNIAEKENSIKPFSLGDKSRVLAILICYSEICGAKEALEPQVSIVKSEINSLLPKSKDSDYYFGVVKHAERHVAKLNKVLDGINSAKYILEKMYEAEADKLDNQ